MLFRLIKHEIKSVWKIFGLLYIATIAMAIVNRLISVYIDSLYPDTQDYGLLPMDKINIATTFHGIARFMLVALFIALIVITLVVMIQRFHKNLLGDEGYLMFTLPVKTSSLILSKFIVSIIFQIFSLICFIINMIIITGENIFTVTKGLVERLGRSWDVLLSYPNVGEVFTTVFSMFFFIIFSWLAANLLIYFCLAIGHLFNRHRILIAVVTFFVVVTGVQIAFALLGVQFLQTIFESVFYVGYTYYEINNLTGYYTMILPGIMLLGTAIIYFVTYKILSKKLNIS